MRRFRIPNVCDELLAMVMRFQDLPSLDIIKRDEIPKDGRIVKTLVWHYNTELNEVSFWDGVVFTTDFILPTGKESHSFGCFGCIQKC